MNYRAIITFASEKKLLLRVFILFGTILAECIPIVAPENGQLNCSVNDTGRVCEASCKQGFFFASPVAKQYVCGSTTSYLWNGQESPYQTEFIVPQCTGDVKQSDIVVIITLYQIIIITVYR